MPAAKYNTEITIAAADQNTKGNKKGKMFSGKRQANIGKIHPNIKNKLLLFLFRSIRKAQNGDE